jgi:hypothetical protein
MSLTNRSLRLESFQLEKIHHYFWYAIGEILLIFAGITLALWFGNWNEERQLRVQEILTLKEITADLTANVEHISQNIAMDNQIIEACERFLKAVTRKDPWRDTYAKDLNQCRWWTSPFLSSAEYESLKSRGTNLISDSTLRNAIVNLYEQTYAFLVEDTDKDFWAFHTSVLLPVSIRYLRYIEPDQLIPNNYESLLNSDEFINMLYWKIGMQKSSILGQQKTLATTEAVIEMIETELFQRAP